MGRKHRLASTVLGVLVLVSLGLGLVSGGNTGPSSASAAKIGSQASAQSQRPQVIVVRVYFRDNAERDRLAVEFGAEEVATLGGYLTVWADQATYNELLQRGL